LQPGASNRSSSPGPCSALIVSVKASPSRQQQKITLQDEAKPFASTVYDLDDDETSENSRDDADTIKERFSEGSNLVSSGEEDEPCQNLKCAELKAKLE